MNTKTILIIGAVAVAGYFAWTWYQKNKRVTTTATAATPARSEAAQVIEATAGAVDELQNLGEAVGLINP